MISKAVRERLLASTIIAGALVAAPAFAQAADTATGQTGAPAGEQTQASAGAAQPGSTGEIVVTGSLIRNPALAATTPVQVLGQEELQLRQTNTAEEVLRNLPGAVADVGTSVNNGNGGFSFVNLRNLGNQRNVVLIDGNRIAPADLVGRTDLNNVPLALIQRTEITTGGAAATYGADAISGVVNFITRNDFSGVEAQVSKQLTEQGDGAYYRADVTIGANFDDGRGNAVISLGYQHSDAVYQGDRNFSRTAIDSFDGSVSGSGTTVPARFSLTGVGTRQINPTTGALVQAYSVAGLAPFNFNPYNVFQTPFERFNIYGAGHYDLTDDLTIYTRGMFSKNTINTIIAPSGLFGTAVTIPYSNPYLPAAARTQFCNANGLTTAQCGAAALATSTTDPNYRTFTTNVSRRAVEVGPRLSDYTTNYFDYRVGIRGNITSSLHFDINGSYGESAQLQTVSGYTTNSKFKDAALATNTTTCLSGNAGCVPVNLFGPAGSITADQAAYLAASSTTTTRTSLGQVRGVLNGDFGVHSPFANEPINFAAGVEYRKYRAFQDADTLAKSGDLGGYGSAVPTVAGGYDVTEGFGELVAPIVEDKPFLQSLELNGGIRYSHYNIEAQPKRSFNTTTWKGGATWQPVEMLKFRGVYQHAVRAPNIYELFTPVQSVLTNLSTDPCQGAGPTTNSNLRAICLAQGAPASAIGTIEAPQAGQANATTGGNLNLRPEKSNSYTLGVVFQPKRLIPGLSITADYFHIKITGEISSSTPSDVISQCFGATPNVASSVPNNATSAACTSIRRDPLTGDLNGDTTVAGLPLFLSNQGRALTDGIDLSANYRRDLGVAILNLSFEGTWTRKNLFQPTPTSTVFNCVSRYGTDCASIQPRFYWNQRTTVTVHGVDLSLLWRHLSRSTYEDAGVASPEEVFGNFGHIPTVNYLDLATRISAGEHVEFTVTVQNLLNKKPPIVGYDLGSTAFNSGNTYPSTYDALGRRYGVSARVKF